ncbi:rhomboid-related protein 1 isoform X4 [Mastomys coucha]|uniref:rhomboid-related protein 1 isoform X4 n=1 Tax=Mastomys coucha TaxID=35658 RepID=UPI0012614765|nr:rhomboid-related protein 1 isoform X4 [Mastomys coucha]
MNLGILGWVKDVFLVERNPREGNKTERLPKRDIGCCRFPAMASWEKLLQHVVESCMQAVVLGRAVRWGTLLPRQCVELGPRVRVQDMRVLWLCARWASISVTLSELGERRAEQAERAGRGGAERSAEQPLPASADPGPRPGSMDRSSLLQLIQEQISSKRSSSFKRAIANGQRALPRDGLLDEPGLGVYKRFVRYVAYEILPCEVDRRWYFYRHRTCPPPVFMASVTLAQIIVFLCYGARLNKWVLQTYHPEYMKSPLVYHPGHRARAWRFLTYMFMHVGLEQLGFNALLQLMIGVPLEMVHGVLRISLLYLAGVLAGSLTVSITDMRAPVVGGSGGVYALCSAHLANVVMNWAGMRCPYKLLRMVLALVCMSSEVGRAVWLRFSPPLPASGPQPSFMAHLAGAVVGVSMGLTILRSYEERLRDQCGWWVVLLAYGTFLLFAIFWNVFAYDLLGADIPPPP